MGISRSSLALVFALLVCVGCSGVQVTEYAGNQPAFDPVTFFDGKLTAHGVVKDRGGRVIRYFNADIKAYWEDGIGTLEEDFVFDDVYLDNWKKAVPDAEVHYLEDASHWVVEDAHERIIPLVQDFLGCHPV